MSDDKMPVQPPTVQLAAVTDRALLEDLARVVKAGFSTNGERLDSQDTKLDKIVTEGIEANVRLDRVETRLTQAEGRVDLLEGRAGKTSMRVGTASQVDLDHAAQLAQERFAREALASKLAAVEVKTDAQTLLLQQIVKLTEKPLVKLIATAIGTAFLGWMAAKGLK